MVYAQGADAVCAFKGCVVVVSAASGAVNGAVNGAGVVRSSRCRSYRSLSTTPQEQQQQKHRWKDPHSISSELDQATTDAIVARLESRGKDAVFQSLIDTYSAYLQSNSNSVLEIGAGALHSLGVLHSLYARWCSQVLGSFAAGLQLEGKHTPSTCCCS